MEKAAVRIPEAARMLSVSPDKMAKAVRDGDVRSIKFRGAVLVPAVELERILGGTLIEGRVPTDAVDNEELRRVLRMVRAMIDAALNDGPR